LKAMFTFLHALGMFVADLFKSRCRLEAPTPFWLRALSQLLLIGFPAAIRGWCFVSSPEAYGRCTVN
jgi:hypothetical protein